MAVALAGEILSKGKEVLFTYVPKLLLEIKKTFREGSEKTGQDLLERYVSSEYLILDDFGLETCNLWVRQTLHYIVCERDNRLHPTLFTSHLSLDENAVTTDRKWIGLGIFIEGSKAAARESFTHVD